MALINLRNALMTGKRLPYDAEVEYLESTGTQWIDTGFIPSSNTSVEIGYKTAEAQLNTVLFGRRVTYSDRSFCVWANANGKIRFDYSANSMDNKDGPNLIVGSWVQIAKRKERNFVNGTEYTANGTKTFACNGNAYLFAMNDNGTANWLIPAQISYCKIWRNGVLVRDLIPVRKGTVGYLYDRVSGRLFGNAGTGDFVLGPDVVPVEWLGCDGSQYIDTKVVATNSHGFRVDIEAAKKAVDVNTRIFGAHEGNIRCGFALYGEPPNDDYFWGWNEAMGFRATIPQRFVVSLNYKNDRAAIFNGTTNISQLGTLGGMTQSVYLLNANYGNAPFANQFVVGKFYGAEITVGSDVANHYIPVRVGTEGAMMDTLTRRIYRNQGTGAFSYGTDLPLETLAN